MGLIQELDASWRPGSGSEDPSSAANVYRFDSGLREVNPGLAPPSPVTGFLKSPARH